MGKTDKGQATSKSEIALASAHAHVVAIGSVNWWERDALGRQAVLATQSQCSSSGGGNGQCCGGGVKRPENQ
ncbi:MAG: hypothetical protein ACYDCC_10870 [Actinomycetota bacterium]